jgi:restriction system protein
MAVPDFQTLMRPLLHALEDGGDHSVQSLRGTLASHFELTPADLGELIPSGRAKTFNNRVGWSMTYLNRSGLIERPKPATYRITHRGRTALQDHPTRVDMKVLAQFPEFVAFKSASKVPPSTPDLVSQALAAPASDETPEELIESAYSDLRSVLAADVLDRVAERSPDFFEQLVLDVLRAMGYGGRHDGAVAKLGKSGDEGVDGVIREDELGLDLIYVQAKRWAQSNVVGRPEIQKFFGALHGKRATKGVFITTSTFSAEAKTYADSVTPRVILVDGNHLAQLMIDHGVGVTTRRSYAVKRIDLDYFATDEDTEETVQPDPLA